MLQRSKGFTLIELLIVAFIIAIMLAIVVPTIMSIRENIKEIGNRDQQIQVMTQEEEAALKQLPQKEKPTDEGNNKKL